MFRSVNLRQNSGIAAMVEGLELSAVDVSAPEVIIMARAKKCLMCTFEVNKVVNDEYIHSNPSL
jgi:hypothetical protein